MDKLTLDTNVLNDWAWCEGKVALARRHGGDRSKQAVLNVLFQKLKLLRDSGVCELGINIQVHADHHETPGQLPPHIEEMLGPYVKINTPGFGIPMVIPWAIIDPEEINRLFRDNFPNSQPGDRKYRSNRADAAQIYAHKIAARDYFITGENPNRWRRSVLDLKWNICVLSLDEYLSKYP